jgi:hypothetical protein
MCRYKQGYNDTLADIPITVSQKGKIGKDEC